MCIPISSYVKKNYTFLFTFEMYNEYVWKSLS